MKNDISKWLQNPTVNPRLTAAVALTWVAGLLILQWVFPMRQVEMRTVAPFLFHSREAMHRAPDLHPSIRIFAMDDPTVASIMRPTLNLEEWAEILEALDSKRPKAIVIDQLFSILDAGAATDGAGKAAVSRIAALTTPIITGTYVAPTKIPGRTAMELDDPIFDLMNYIDKGPALPFSLDEQAAALPLADMRKKIVYGPHASLEDAFHNVGHILYGQMEGRTQPFLRLDHGKVLPHIMFRAFEPRFSQGRLTINDYEMKLDKDGSLPIDFVSPKALAGNVLAFHQLLNPKFRAATLKKIAPGDIVYMIPMYFTGNTDFKPSPIGIIPGAFAHLGVLNSILKRSGLYTVDIETEMTVGFGFVVAFLGWWLSPASLILLLLLLSLSWTCVVVLGFAFVGMVLPLLMPQACFFGVGVSLVLHRIYVSERKARVIRHALEGVVRPQALKELQRHPEKLTLEARERVVTVMFIDIVGFSLMVENQLPRVAFDGLQQLIQDMSERIHAHGGIVNKTLGDGLLCFFGYSLEGDRETSNHAQEALAAAIDIQKFNVPRIIANDQKREPVFPLRIGINTAAVFMGNLGAGERLDITVIGNGVNFAKRLESACMPHSILVGTNTQELLPPNHKLGSPTRRLISIKHHNDMVESWEYDPFESQPELRRKAEEIYESTSHLTRMERRWSVLDKENILVITLSGSGHLLNFSSAGLSFSLGIMLPRGTTTTIELDSADGTLRNKLASYGLQRIQVEVRWVQHRGSDYVHGIRYLELDNRQIEIITDFLCQFGLEKDQQNSLGLGSAS